MGTVAIKTARLELRVSPIIKLQLETAAKEKRRTLSSLFDEMIEKYLAEGKIS